MVTPQEKVSFNPVAMDSHVPGSRRFDGTAALLSVVQLLPFREFNISHRLNFVKNILLFKLYFFERCLGLFNHSTTFQWYI